MFALLSEIGRRAAAAIRASGVEASAVPDELAVVRAGKPEFGDFQISQCLQLGKALGKAPRELAVLVAEALKDHPALAKVEIAGPGFVNLHVADAWLAERLLSRRDDPRLGLREVGRGARVVLDFSSPNVAKPMHIGHIRSTIIGDALARILAALGHDVIRDNHIGDWGTQFGKLIVAYRRWLDADAYAADPVAELLRLYTSFNAEEKREREALGLDARKPADEGEGEESDEIVDTKTVPILEEARKELVKLQAGDPENTALWRKFLDDSRHVFERIYDRLGVRFDYWLGESAYNQMLPVVVAELERRGLAVPSRGAKVVFLDEEKLDPYIVQKRDGGYNYATTDIATMAVRVGLFGAARILIVTDERQQLHFKQLFAVTKRMGFTVPVEHVWFGLMRLPEGTIKTREAGKGMIHLSELLDEAERRAYDVAGEHNPELDEKERREVARVVGIGAVKYNDLSKDRQTLVTFTWDKALALNGNTAPYLQYAYARVKSILRKAETEVAASDGQDAALQQAMTGELSSSQTERNLAKRILAYPEVVENVARTARPHLLCDYLYDLSQAFSTFYNEHPVLKAEPAVRAARLEMTALVARVLAYGLGLLGIDVLERM